MVAPKIGIIIQARIGSSRMPGKIFYSLADGCVLSYCYDRALRTMGVDSVVVALGANQSTSSISEIMNTLKIPFFIGDEDDVLKRCLEVSRRLELDVICRITADCPLWDWNVGSLVLERYFERYGRDAVSHRKHAFYLGTGDSFAEGLDFEVLSRGMMCELDSLARSQFDREHWTWIVPRILDGRPTLENVNVDSQIRLTIDSATDYAVLLMLEKAIGGCKNVPFSKIREYLLGSNDGQRLLTLMGTQIRNEMTVNINR